MTVHYSFALRSLHWLTLLGLLIAYASIELRALVDLTPGQRKVVAFTHVYAGITVLGMMISRLLLRLRQPSARISYALNWQQWAAKIVHSLLYTLFITLPLLSLCARYFRGHAWSFLSIPMPISQHPDLAMAKLLMSWHVELANVGYWLIGLHVLAALFHHFFLQDNSLRTMLPWTTEPVAGNRSENKKN